jgi:glycosyltransferase involved in cell wall biosynthesis
MKKICHVVFEEFPNDPRVRRYTNALISQGFIVFIVCIGDRFEKSVKSDGRLNIFRVPIKKRRSSFKRRITEYIFFEFISFFIVSWISLKYKVKLFHVHTLPDFLVFSCVLPKLLGAKIILDFHELFPEAMIHINHISEQSPLIRILKLQEKISYTFANEIITIHEPAKEIFQKRLGNNKKINVVMNGIDTTEIPLIQKEISEKFIIIYNGTVNYNVNLLLLIKALSILKINYNNIYNNIEFHIFGKGPDLDNIISLSNKLKLDNVFYYGYVRFQNLINKIANANICVLPMKKDLYTDLGYSLKLTEMIYLKIPVIATRLNTYLKYYPENCLLYFNSDDVNNLVEKIIFAYENPYKLRNYTSNAFKEYQKYNWDIMRKRYVDLINKMIY